ncbi:retrovirus-related pol polyprotein from transposon TNT 1-94, partial [Tanacetum coccineum]
RSPNISYFHVFGCHVHIHNYKDHLGKFDEKADDGFFLGYSLVAKAFRVFNIRRQEMEETIHVIFSEDDEAISQTSTKGDAINFNENMSFPDDEFIKPRTKDTQCSVNIEYILYVSAYENITLAGSPTLQNSATSEEPPEFTIANDLTAIHKPDHDESADTLESAEPQDNVLSESISDDQPTPIISPSVEVILQNPVPQDRWSREKHIKLVNIIGEPLAGITTRSRVRDSDAASAHECLYVNFLSEIKPKKLIEALEEEGWVIAMQEEMNQFERNKEGIDYEKTFAPVARLEAIIIFLAYVAYMSFVVFQMDTKSAFLNGKISEEVYVQQPPRFKSSEFPDHVCKRDKALYQANPKESHLVAVKRIFRYLKGTPNLGLWYSKGSGFDLKAYSESVYAGCNLDKKSTSAKAEYVVEAEYVAAVGCCAQVLWIKMLHSRTKHIDIKYHFIRDHILKGDIKLHFVPTEMQLTDIFTKPLAKPSFTRLVAELESTLSENPQCLLTPSSKVKFQHHESISAYNNDVALPEHHDPLFKPMLSFLSNYSIFTALTKEPLAMYIEYLKDFWYTAEVDDSMKDILFSLLVFKNQLSFTRFDFLTAIGLTDSTTVVPLPPKGTVRAGLATLGLADKDKPSLTSTELQAWENNKEANICYKIFLSLVFEQLVGENYSDKSLTILKPHTITAASFQKPLASEVPLTSHMLKVAKLSKEPGQFLLLPFGEVNVEESADESQSGTNVQPLSQPKAPTTKHPVFKEHIREVYKYQVRFLVEQSGDLWLLEVSKKIQGTNDVCVCFSNVMEVPMLHVLHYRLPLSMKSQPLSQGIVF